MDVNLKMAESANVHDEIIGEKSTTYSYSCRDLSIIPSELNFGFIDNFAKANNKSSGAEHMSKGIKYFSEGYIKDIKRMYFFSYVSSNILQKHFLKHSYYHLYFILRHTKLIVILFTFIESSLA